MYKRRNQSRRYQKAFYFVDNLRENVLGNFYSLDLNYDMELEIQGRVHFGKTEDNRANTSEVEVGRLVQSVRQQVCKFLRFSNHGLLLLCLVVQKRQLDIFLTSRHHSWNDHPSLKLYRRYSHLYGV